LVNKPGEGWFLQKGFKELSKWNNGRIGLFKFVCVNGKKMNLCQPVWEYEVCPKNVIG